ncbi:MAG: hypothetical protein E1N59_845 [Puniceicoccaceae bacterium 5H]|nr:MAG: hypothetical protein E1N59_845 [Puniceicoccaceae bacterium 5H]
MLRHSVAGMRISSLALLALAFAGCVNVQQHRARHQIDAFDAYGADKQTRLLAGTIAQGDEPEAVYIALGPPEARFPTPKGDEGWIYVGTAGEETAETVTFESRASNGWGGDREELVVVLTDGHVTSWELRPLGPVGIGVTGETERQRERGELVDWRGPRLRHDPYASSAR